MKPLGPPPASPNGFTLDEFCRSFRVSRTRLYQFWKEGRGPRYIQNGARRIITAEAASDWCREREADAYAERLRQEIAGAPDRDAAGAISKREEKELQKYPGQHGTLVEEYNVVASENGGARKQ